ICFVQMAYGRTARMASAVAGGILLPVFIVMTAIMVCMVRGPYYGPPPDAILCMLVFSFPFGAFLGYLTGTMAAGIFLVMDLLETHLKRRRPISDSAAA